jgi:hypothetical protein
MILSGSVENTFPSGHGSGGGGSEVASAGDTGVGLAVAADGGDEVSPEDVSSEERVLGVGAGDVGVDITRAAGGGEESGPGVVDGEEVELRAGAGAESRVPTGCIAGSWGRSAKQNDCSEIGEAVGVGHSGSGDRAEGGVRRSGGT